jgi:hypothetical protein
VQPGGQVTFPTPELAPREEVPMEEEGPAMGWVREYNAKNISLDELTNKIASHDFEERKGKAQLPTLSRALEYRDADYEPGTFDEVYRAKAYGLLTKQEMEAILDQVEKREAEKGVSRPHHECSSGSSPKQAPTIELRPSSEPYLIKVDDGYVKISITG